MRRRLHNFVVSEDACVSRSDFPLIKREKRYRATSVVTGRVEKSCAVTGSSIFAHGFVKAATGRL
jgi:hypothetical protein